MKKKVIKLNENDIEILVKKILKEGRLSLSSGVGLIRGVEGDEVGPRFREDPAINSLIQSDDIEILNVYGDWFEIYYTEEARDELRQWFSWDSEEDEVW